MIREWCESGVEPLAQEAKPDEIGNQERDELLKLLDSSTYDETQRTTARGLIAGYTTLVQYNNVKTKLLNNQKGIQETVNPSASQVNGAAAKAAAMDN
jgi:hypothetical protein